MSLYSALYTYNRRPTQWVRANASNSQLNFEPREGWDDVSADVQLYFVYSDSQTHIYCFSIDSYTYMYWWNVYWCCSSSIMTAVGNSIYFWKISRETHTHKPTGITYIAHMNISFLNTLNRDGLRSTRNVLNNLFGHYWLTAAAIATGETFVHIFTLLWFTSSASLAVVSVMTWYVTNGFRYDQLILQKYVSILNNRSSIQRSPIDEYACAVLYTRACVCVYNLFKYEISTASPPSPSISISI